MEIGSSEATWLGLAGFRKLRPTDKEIKDKLKQVERSVSNSDGVVGWDDYAMLMVLARRGLNGKD